MPPFRGDDHFFDLSGYFRARYPKEKEYQVKLAVNTALRKCFEDLQRIGYLSEESPFAGHSWEFAFEELTGNPFLTGKKEQPISKIKRDV